MSPCPSVQDERGIEGVIIMDQNKKKVLVGTRLAATKERKKQHEEKENQEEEYDKIQTGLDVKTMSEARPTVDISHRHCQYHMRYALHSSRSDNHTKNTQQSCALHI